MDCTHRGDSGEILVVEAPTDLEQVSAESFKNEVLRRLPRIEGACLIVDMGPTTYLASVGVAVLLELHEHCRARDTAFAIAGIDAQPLELLGMLKLLDRLPTAQSVDEAEGLVSGAGPG